MTRKPIRILPPDPSPARPDGIKGRGASANPPVRFETLVTERGPDWTPDDDPAPTTQFLIDATRSILADNDSPDLGFETSFNPYRGCEHGCIYCYARPTHEYLGMSAGLDFESKILVKTEAPRLMREALSAPGWRPRVVMASGVTDCYQPVERRARLTRGCLEVLAEFRNPVSIITKNALVARDLDLFRAMAAWNGIAVTLSVTTLRPELSRVLEPRTSVPQARLEAVRQLADAGIPVGVNLAPMIPGLTDHEIPAILAAAAAAGARYAGFTLVRLPYGVAPLFEQWLSEHAPLAKDKVLNHIRAMRGGKLNDARFGSRMRGEGPYAQQMADLFAVARRRNGFSEEWPELSTSAFRPPGGVQGTIFDA